jgi:hypothetical protein
MPRDPSRSPGARAPRSGDPGAWPIVRPSRARGTQAKRLTGPRAAKRQHGVAVGGVCPQGHSIQVVGRGSIYSTPLRKRCGGGGVAKILENGCHCLGRGVGIYSPVFWQLWRRGQHGADE